MDYAEGIRMAPVLLDFEAPDEKSAIMQVANLLRPDPAVRNADTLVSAIWERQCIQAPLLGNGVALPHARTQATSNILFALGRLLSPVAFGAEHQEVNIIILYVSPPELVAQSLTAVASLAARLRKPEALSGLLSAGNEEDFKQWLI